MTIRKSVISGASKGIGYAIARRLAADGADVGLLASHEGRLRDAAERIQKETGRQAAYHAADLRTLEGCEGAHRSIADTLGGCDILGTWPPTCQHRRKPRQRDRVTANAIPDPVGLSDQGVHPRVISVRCIKPCHNQFIRCR